jgi:hypothetical protein
MSFKRGTPDKRPIETKTRRPGTTKGILAILQLSAHDTEKGRVGSFVVHPVVK